MPNTRPQYSDLNVAEEFAQHLKAKGIRWASGSWSSSAEIVSDARVLFLLGRFVKGTVNSELNHDQEDDAIAFDLLSFGRLTGIVELAKGISCWHDDPV